MSAAAAVVQVPTQSEHRTVRPWPNGYATSPCITTRTQPNPRRHVRRKASGAMQQVQGQHNGAGDGAMKLHEF
jgi:hypothetical protein